jgi:hypothetical protein
VKLTVISTLPFAESEFLVRFESRYGSGTARWARSRHAALPGTYDVEWDFEPSKAAYRLEAAPTSFAYGFSMIDGDLALCAEVEQVEEDGVITLRVGDDFLMLVDLPALAEKAGGRVMLRGPAECFKMTPF